MKVISNIKMLLVAVVSVVTIASCMSRDKYVKSEEFNENVFRTDYLPKDSSTVAQISWREFFRSDFAKAY